MRERRASLPSASGAASSGMVMAAAMGSSRLELLEEAARLLLAACAWGESPEALAAALWVTGRCCHGSSHGVLSRALGGAVLDSAGLMLMEALEGCGRSLGAERAELREGEGEWEEEVLLTAQTGATAAAMEAT